MTKEERLQFCLLLGKGHDFSAIVDLARRLKAATRDDPAAALAREVLAEARKESSGG